MRITVEIIEGKDKHNGMEFREVKTDIADIRKVNRNERQEILTGLMKLLKKLEDY